MLTSIAEMQKRAQGGTPRTLAVAAAHDEDVLRAVVAAQKAGMVQPILVGDRDKIAAILAGLGEEAGAYPVEGTGGDAESAEVAVGLVTSGRADFLMKGLLGTATMMKAVIDKEKGLRTGRLISHVVLYEAPGYGKVFVLTDGGMNTYPDLDKKADILENAAITLQELGYASMTAACICGAEVVDPKIQSTVDADALAHMESRWAPYNMNVLGPVGLDLAISPEACKHKGYSAPGCGQADILLVPTYEVGNGIGKTLSYFANAKSAGIIRGARVPIVLVSRADDAETKLASIAFGCLLCNKD